MNENPVEEYLKALRLGKKWYYKQISQGKSGFLLSMEDQFPIMELTSEINLGLEKVPLHKIIGTWSRARANLFTRNFLPLASPDTSEFASKWKALYQSHIEIGINEPVKLYEYMNWYYVVEGNKRISVLNYVNALTVDAIVIRLQPGRTPLTEEKQIYFEFIDFKRETGISEIWITRSGGYKTLIDNLENYNQPSYLSDENKYTNFLKNLYNPFRTLFHSLGGQKKLRMTTGDAFLRYIEIFNISDTFKNEKEKSIINRLIEELIVEESGKSNQLITDEIKKEKGSVKQLYSKINILRKQLKVLFLYARDINTSGWNFAHEQGRIEAQKALGERVHTYSLSNIPENDSAFQIISDEIKKGVGVVFSTSPFFKNATLKASIQFPDIHFYTCSSSPSTKRMKTYSGQSFESSFLAGVLAALLDKEGKIGYIASHSGIERYSRINGFINGIRLIHPNCSIPLLWNNFWDFPEKSRKLAKTLLNKDCNIIFQHSLPKPGNLTGEYGLYNFSGETVEREVQHFAATVWNWGSFYRQMIENILISSRGDFKGFPGENLQINFWGGLRSKIVDLVINENIVPLETFRLVTLIKNSLINRQIHPFLGPVYDNTGILRIENGKRAELEEIRTMDWLCEGITEYTEADYPN